MIQESKPGVKTTEFWVCAAPVIGGLIECMKGDAEMGKLLIICGTALGVIYIASRTIVKFK